MEKERLVGKNELIARTRGLVVREFIKNDEAESYSFELTERSESEELERNYHLEKRPRREEKDVD